MWRVDTTPYTPYDVLLVLGRSSDEHGEISLASKQRAVAAAQASKQILPQRVVFSGGRSWRQVAAGFRPPPEGEAMRKWALQELHGKIPTGVEFIAENESTNTAENMVFSAPLLKLRPGDTLAIMSDERHFAYGRIHRLGDLVFPDIQKVAIRLPNPEPVRRSEPIEEWLLSVVTRVGLAGVRQGDAKAVLRRHQWLKTLNELQAKLPVLRSK